LRVAFAGTPPFAATALEALVASGHEVAMVLTQPDRPAGRGMRLTPSAVSQAAQSRGLPVAKYATLRDSAAQSTLREARLDVMVVAAYGLLLPPEVLGIPVHGCINIHASLLPRWRGAAPIQRAILAGDQRTGVSIMQMDAGLDTGPVLLEEEIEIGPSDTTGSLTHVLARLGAQAMVQALSRLHELHPRPQDSALATHAAKVTRAEAAIDWTQPNDAIDRRVRAYNPAPGAETRLGEEVLKIWEAAPIAGSGRPGEIIVCNGQHVVVACGRGALELRRLQRPGGKPVSAVELARGSRISQGARFQSANHDFAKPLMPKT
jgi:methionyl-tRNA formyltransferase